MNPPRRSVLALVPLAGLALSACQSSQKTSAELAAKAEKVQQATGLRITSPSRDVRVVSTAVVTDQNGSAVAVRLANRSGRPQADVPLLVDLADAKGSSVFRNDAAGLQRSLTHAALIPARGEATWVNDQVTASGRPVRARVTVGPAARPAPAGLLALHASGVRIDRDPTSGVAGIGLLTNSTDVPQRQVLVTVVAKRGGRVVAAGRGVVPKVRPSARARFRVFFIGDPRGASLAVTAVAGTRGAGS